MFSCEKGSIVFEYDILPDIDNKLWANDPWWANAYNNYITANVMASKIVHGL